MESDILKELADVKEMLKRIENTLQKAGIGVAPAKVVDISKKALEIKERLDRRNGC